MAWVSRVRHDLPGPPQSPTPKQGLKGGRGQPITLSVQHITRCSLALSLAAAAGNQMMAEVMIDLMMAV